MTVSLLHFPQNSLLTLNQNSHFLFHWGSRNSQKTFTKFCSQLSDLLSSVPTYFNFTSRTLLEVTSYPLLLHLISSPLSFLKTVSLEILYSLFLMHHFFSFYGCPLDTCYNIFHFTKPFYLACPPHCCPTSLLYFVANPQEVSMLLFYIFHSCLPVLIWTDSVEVFVSDTLPHHFWQGYQGFPWWQIQWMSSQFLTYSHSVSFLERLSFGFEDFSLSWFYSYPSSYRGSVSFSGSASSPYV